MKQITTKEQQLVPERPAENQAVWLELFNAAVSADDAFQAECLRQFGSRAADGRYNRSAHDARTRAALDRKLEADDDLRAAQGQPWTPETARQRVGGTFGS